MRGVGTVLALVVPAPVVRRSGIALEPDHTEREEASARCRLADAGIRRLDELSELSELEAVPDVAIDRLRRGLTARLDDARDRLTDHNGRAAPAESADLVHRRLRRDLIGVEALELQRSLRRARHQRHHPQTPPALPGPGGGPSHGRLTRCRRRPAEDHPPPRRSVRDRFRPSERSASATPMTQGVRLSSATARPSLGLIRLYPTTGLISPPDDSEQAVLTEA